MGMADHTALARCCCELNQLGGVGATRFELVTFAMSTQRSNQLSYAPRCPNYSAGFESTGAFTARGKANSHAENAENAER